MDFFNRSLRQASDLFRSLSPAARITTALLLAVIVISVTYLFRAQTGGAGELLLGGEEYSQSEVAAMEAAFAQKGLGDWTVEGNRIRVPHGQKAKYLAAAAEGEALPKNYGDVMEGVFKEESWSTPRALRDERLKNAREQQIALVITEMSGIDKAMVSYSEDKLPGFGQKIERRASANVKAVGNAHLSLQQVRTIRNTVASMIGGLDRRNVGVTDLNSSMHHTAIDDLGNPSASEDPYFAHKQQYEREFRETIMRGLRDIPSVIAEVNVTLDPEIDRREQTQKLDKDGFMLRTEEETTTRTASVEAKGGQPGAAPNGVGPNTAAEVTSSETNKTNEEKSRSQNEGITGGTITSKRMASYVPQFVAATVKIPTSYIEELWKKRNPTPEGQTPKTPDPNEIRTITTDTIRKIEEVVVQLLPPKPPGDDRYKPVTVTTYELLAPPEPAPPSVVDSATAWLGEWWSTLGVLLLGLVSLLMLRGMLKSSDSPPAAREAAATASAGSSAGEGDSTDSSTASETADGETPAEPPRRRRFKAAGPNLRDELAAMVRENPDAAANVLRSWIGDAA